MNSPNNRPRKPSGPRVPVAPLPECPATFRLTHTSIGYGQAKKKEPRATLSEFQELERLAQSDVNMALKCPPLSVAPGPYSLAIHTTSPVSLPPRKSFLTGVKSSIVVNKRWKRSQTRARNLAMSDNAYRTEVKQTAKLIGLSASEFNRSREGLTNFIVDMKQRAIAKDGGDEESNSDSDDGDKDSIGNGANSGGGGGGGGETMKLGRRARRAREKDARLAVYHEFSSLCKQTNEKQNVLSSFMPGGSSSLVSKNNSNSDLSDDQSLSLSHLAKPFGKRGKGQQLYNTRVHSLMNSSSRLPNGAEMLAKAKGKPLPPESHSINLDDPNKSFSKSITQEDNQAALGETSTEFLESKLLTSLDNIDGLDRDSSTPHWGINDVKLVVRAVARLRMKSRQSSRRARSRGKTTSPRLTSSFFDYSASSVNSDENESMNMRMEKGGGCEKRDSCTTFMTSVERGAMVDEQDMLGSPDSRMMMDDDDQVSFDGSSSTDSISLPGMLQGGGGAGGGFHGGSMSKMDSEVHVCDLVQLIHGDDFEYDGGLDPLAGSNDFHENSPRSPNNRLLYVKQGGEGHSPNNISLCGEGNGSHTGSGSPVPHHSTGLGMSSNSVFLEGGTLAVGHLSASLRRAIKHIHDALILRGLNVAFIVDAAYLDQWQRGHSDMFLEVSDEGPPKTLEIGEAERLILNAVSLSREDATAMKARVGILRKRRERAERRSASKVWLSNPEPLPKSMTKPEYLTKLEVEASIIASETFGSAIFDDHDALLDTTERYEGFESPRNGSEDDHLELNKISFTEFKPSHGASYGSLEKNQKNISRNSMKKKDGRSFARNNPKSYDPKKIVLGNKHAQREVQQARQLAFEIKKYPAFTKENLRR